MLVPGGHKHQVTMHSAAAATGNGTELQCASDGDGVMSIAAFSVEGINGDTITFEVTLDGSNWYGILCENITSGTEATTATADGIYRATVAGVLSARARISTYSAGTITVVGLVTP